MSLKYSLKLKVLVAQLHLALYNSMYCILPDSVHWIVQAKILEWVAISFSRGTSQPRNWTRVSRTMGRCFTDWAIQKAPLLHLRNHKMWNVACQVPLFMGFSRKDTGVSCHSLLQGIFLTQGSNPGLLPCRQVLYCLSHQGSPFR